MAQYHLLHIIPDPSLHGLNGYKEVIDTVAWGLLNLGHQVTYAVNQAHRTARNILFGAQMLSAEAIMKLPADSIWYNLEQMRNVDPSMLRQSILLSMERFELWEYASVNIPAWQKLGDVRVKLVPIGYAPVLTRIAKAPVQDIDVLIYGMAGIKRMTAFHQLSIDGLTSVFVSGLYGAARDELIARAKLVLNVNLYDHAQIFEVVRVSYLLANSKVVVATKDPFTFIESDIEAAVKLTTMDQLVSDCRTLVADPAGRAAMERQGLEIMARRDIRSILQSVLPAA